MKEEIDFSDYLYYDETSPTFLRWKVYRTKGRKNAQITASPGDVAGSVGTDHGYTGVKINSVKYSAHRVVWYLVYGLAPMCIDHIDGDKENNHVSNLREISQKANCQNKGKQWNNTSGVTGVYFTTKDNSLYVVASSANGDGSRNSKWFSTKKLGLLPAFSEAVKCRDAMIESLRDSGENYTNRHGT